MDRIDPHQETPSQETRSSGAATPSPRGWRVGFLLLGWVFFALGAVGAFLPVLPTTPFMILALWAFSRSSQRFHLWLLNHRIVGPPLQRWTEHRVVPLLAKIAAVTAMAASLAYLIWFSDIPAYAVVLSALFMAGAAGYVLTRPGRTPG